MDKPTVEMFQNISTVGLSIDAGSGKRPADKMGFPKGVTQSLCPRPPLAAGGTFDS